MATRIGMSLEAPAQAPRMRRPSRPVHDTVTVQTPQGGAHVKGATLDAALLTALDEAFHLGTPFQISAPLVSPKEAVAFKYKLKLKSNLNVLWDSAEKNAVGWNAAWWYAQTFEQKRYHVLHHLLGVAGAISSARQLLGLEEDGT